MAHTRHHAGDLPVPKKAGDRRPPLSRDGHARPVRAGARDGARGAGRERRRGDARARRRIHPDPRRLPRDPRVQPRSKDRSRGRHRHHPLAQSAARRRLQVQPAERRTRRVARHRMDPDAGERAPRECSQGREEGPLREGSSCLHDAPVRLPRSLRRRSRRRDRHGRPSCREDPHGGRPARWGRGPLLGADRRALRAGPHRRERCRRPDVPLHDRRLGRPDPHGPIVSPMPCSG